MKKRLYVLALALAGLILIVFAAEKTMDIYNGSLEDRVNALAKIQPGLGTVMIEYGDRFANTYYAAKGGNWGLAQYQLKEATEIQEVGEITRPKNAPLLKSFEHAYLDPLMKDIENKDWASFEKNYSAAVEGCNGCHKATGHGYVEYKLPAQPVEAYINFNLKTDPVGNVEAGEEHEENK
ncbi:hypothetical protein [Oceanithermus sp.]|uniref:hypothetical protein n=1 Tax=Oceanithermus sp. TaxID=2268145 RepID=UPI00257FC6A9|nr:hypothetical protein [Oceanithermus sp.]